MYLKYFQLMVDSSLLLQDALVFDGLTDAYGKYHMVRKYVGESFQDSEFRILRLTFCGNSASKC